MPEAAIIGRRLLQDLRATDFTKYSFVISHVYSELSQTPKMGCFAKIGRVLTQDEGAAPTKSSDTSIL